MSWIAALAAVSLATACGDDDDGGSADAATAPDAAPDAAIDAASLPIDAAATDAAAPADAADTDGAGDGGAGAACAELESPDGEISTFPGNFAGNINAGSTLIDVSDMDCAVQDAPLGVGAPGAEQVVRLAGLTAGIEYGVEVDANFDATIYVATSCTGDDGPAMGECLLYVDTFDNPERGTFTQPSFIAPTDGVAYVVVDYFSTTPPANGTYLLTVAEVECVTSFDCATAGAVVCELFECVAGPSACVGDDGTPPEDDDDGPFGATALVLGAPAAGSVCSEPAAEGDFYSVAVAGGDDLALVLAWTTGGVDLDLFVYDSAGAPIAEGFSSANPERVLVEDLAAGTYYVQVDRFESFDMGMPVTTTTVEPYTLTASIAECAWDGDCTTPGFPVCAPEFSCDPGYSDCTDDDAAEDDDDGAGLGTPVAPVVDGSPVSFARKLCSSPAAGAPGSSLERDWYAVTVGGDQTLTVRVSWSGAADIDVFLHDASGLEIDKAATVSQPEVMATDLTAGTYYVFVEQYSPIAVAAAGTYTASFELATTP